MYVAASLRSDAQKEVNVFHDGRQLGVRPLDIKIDAATANAETNFTNLDALSVVSGYKSNSVNLPVALKNHSILRKPLKRGRLSLKTACRLTSPAVRLTNMTFATL